MMMLPGSCASVGITSPVTATTRSDVWLLRPHQMTPLSLPDTEERWSRSGTSHHLTTTTNIYRYCWL